MEARWLELAREFDSENLLPIVGELLSNNGISLVFRGENGIYKRSIPFLIENELWCLEAMVDSGFVPRVERYDKYTLLLEDLGKSQPITDSELFWENLLRLLESLRSVGIRHGDLTTQALIIRDNFPYLIDFAESRLANDPRPDKRKDSDVYMAEEIYQELVRRMGEE